MVMDGDRMEKVRKFDEEMRNIYADVFYMGRIAECLLCGFGMLLLFIPFEMMSIKSIAWFGSSICMIGVSTYMKCYLGVNEGGKRVSIYQKLAFMPVTKAEIKKVRYQYLNQKCRRIAVAGFIIQEGVSLFSHSFGVESLFYMLVWIGAVWGISWISVFLS